MEVFRICSMHRFRYAATYVSTSGKWMNIHLPLVAVPWVSVPYKVNPLQFSRALTYACHYPQQSKHQLFHNTSLQRQFNHTVSLCFMEPSLLNRHKHSYSSANVPHDRIKHTSKIRKTETDKHQIEQTKSDVAQTEEAPQSVGLMQRFKNAYKQYGKTLVAVHVATSVVWFGCFYYAAASGIDLVPLLEKMGASETILKPFKSTGLGDVAVAYLLYKLATPARYTVTILGTQQAAKYLKTTGYIQPIPEGDSIKELMKEGSKHVSVTVKKRSDRMRHKVRTRTRENREKLKVSYGEYKQKSSDFLSQKAKNKTRER